MSLTDYCAIKYAGEQAVVSSPSIAAVLTVSLHFHPHVHEPGRSVSTASLDSSCSPRGDHEVAGYNPARHLAARAQATISRCMRWSLGMRPLMVRLRLTYIGANQGGESRRAARCAALGWGKVRLPRLPALCVPRAWTSATRTRLSGKSNQLGDCAGVTRDIRLVDVPVGRGTDRTPTLPGGTVSGKWLH